MKNYNNTHVNNSHSSTTNKRSNEVDGIYNWLALLFGISAVNLVIDNYMSYGILKDPIQITIEFLEFMRTGWWYFIVPIISLLLQTVLCLFIEKLLAKEFLSEKIGMSLHFINACLSLNLCSALCFTCKLNPFTGIILVTHILIKSVKFWSYATKNKKYRDVNRNKKKNDFDEQSNKEEVDNITDIKYPQNLTCQNIIQFIFHTSATVYDIKGFKKKSPNYRKAIKGVVQAVFIYYSCAFLVYQYLVPEGNKIVQYTNAGQYSKVLSPFSKLVLPVHAIWLLYFYHYCFKIYLPMLNWLSGIEDIRLETDWWNSTNTTMFWTKWNYQVHMFLKECFFLPTLEMGCNKRIAALTVGIASGILHEYLISIPCRSSYGIPSLFMLIQIPLASLTGFINKRFGGNLGNLIVWSTLILGQPLGAALMYYKYMTLE